MPLIAPDVAAAPTPVETVVVTAARLPPSVGDAAFSIISLNAAELATQPRLDTALSQAPGVSLFRRTSSTAANPTTQGLSLRSIAGSGAGRGLVTLDGVPQNDPFGGWVIWTGLPGESLEGAQIVRGAGAGPYGAGALTGVVALEELSRPGAVQADISAATEGGYRGAAAGVIPIGEASLFLSGSAENNDGWVPVRYGAGPADDRLTLKDYSLAARLQAPLGRALMAVRVGAYREDRDAGLVGAESTARGQSASVTITAQPSADELGYRLQAWVHDSDLYNTSVAVAAGRLSTTPANDQYHTPAVGWGFNAALRGEAGALTWETGADVRGASGEDQELFRYMGGAFTRNRVAGGRTLVAGVYGETSLVEGPWLFTGGARIDGWWSQDGHRTERDTTTDAITFSDSPPDRSGAVPSLRIAAKRDLGSGVYLRAAGYSGFRPPTLNEIYRPFRVGNDITEANAALKPERLYGAEAGLGGEEGAFTWNATGFYNQLDDAITNVTIGSGPGVIAGFPGAGFIPAGGTLRQRQNAGAIKAWGVEADAHAVLAPSLTARAAVDYTHAKVDGGAAAPQLTGLRPAQTPRLTLTAGLDWRAIDRLTLSGDLRYESARYDDDINTRRLKAAVETNLRADWALTRSTTVYVAADNVLNEDIPTGVTADGAVSYDAPRVFRIGFSLRR